ncbi:TetR/AcrR family transcriptional regulator [Arsenicicoccus dermatophilus]|uniref:TetR/AcrR family transcriptional regulator n=1 Tax=Arsenicicoccus dermatophilus TaxID=1076331 RepID=UPI001F4CEF84|nr:TetR/AcrR family transcriptional regulator [Arsenicicoccus dermatophilus]
MQTRRDLAKLETRAALVEAAVELLREEGLAALSADAIAARAGVSRRTFFNYFPTTDAVLAVPSIDFLGAALAAFRARPVDEPLIDSLSAALSAPDMDLVERFATVVRSCCADATADRVEREVWGQAEAEVASVLAGRLGAEPDSLRLQVLSACVLATGRAALLAWVAAVPASAAPDAGAADTTTPDSTVTVSTHLREHLVAAFGYLDQGLSGAPA